MIFTNLLANMILVNASGVIQTSTPSFEHYAYEVMITNAQPIAAIMRVEPNQVATGKVTQLTIWPRVEGYSVFCTFSDRYEFKFFKEFGGDQGFSFTDKAYFEKLVFAATNDDFVRRYGVAHKNAGPRESELDALESMSVAGDREPLQKIAEGWLAASNHLTFRSARRIAESAIASLGIPTKTAGLKSPRGEQKEWTGYGTSTWVQPDQLVTGEVGRVLDVKGVPKGGEGVVSVVGPYKDGRYLVTTPPVKQKKRLLPYYEFRWVSERAECSVDVCGINSNVVFFSYKGPDTRIPAPTNYIQMLGLPSDVVFVERWLDIYRQYKPLNE